MVRTRSLNQGRGSDRLAKGVIGGWVIFWVLWLILKIAAIPVFVINLIWLVQAFQQNSVGTFDFTWFILSIVGLIIL